MQKVKFDHERENLWEAVGITEEELKEAYFTLLDNLKNFVRYEEVFAKWIRGGNGVAKISAVIWLMINVMASLEEAYSRKNVQMTPLEIGAMCYMMAFFDIFKKPSLIVEHFWKRLPDCTDLHNLLKQISMAVLLSRVKNKEEVVKAIEKLTEDDIMPVH